MNHISIYAPMIKRKNEADRSAAFFAALLRVLKYREVTALEIERMRLDVLITISYESSDRRAFERRLQIEGLI